MKNVKMTWGNLRIKFAPIQFGPISNKNNIWGEFCVIFVTKSVSTSKGFPEDMLHENDLGNKVVSPQTAAT